MPAPNRHIIHRQVLDIQVGSGEAGHTLQETLSRIAWKKLRPALEKLFDKYAGPEELTRIDRLEVELGRLPREGLEEAFLVRVLEALEEQLRRQVQQPPGHGVERMPLRQSQFQHWLVFLATGVLPWEAAQSPQGEWQQQVLEALASDSRAIDQLTALLGHNDRAAQRLILQHDESFLLHILETLTARKAPEWAPLSQELGRLWKQAEEWTIEPVEEKELLLIPQAKAIFWKLLLKVVARHRSYPEPIAVLQQFFRQTIPQASADSTLAPSLESRLRRFISGEARQYPILLRLLEKQRGEGALFGKAKAESSKPGLASLADFEPSAREPGLDKALISEGHSENFSGTTPSSPDAVSPEDPPEAGSLEQLGGAISSSEEAITPKTAGQEQFKEEEETGAPELQVLSKKKTKIEEPMLPDKNLGEAAEEKPAEADTALREKPVAKEEQEAGESARPMQEEAVAVPEVPAFSEMPEGAFFTVYYAGVVILHPYLPALFRELGLLEGKAFRDEPARHRAIHLIHWLASGRSEAPEYELLLPKFLCNLPFETPIERAVEWEARELEEAEKMLRAVISNWEALKNTSPEGLRDGFLQRDGKLEKYSDGWRLSVERKTIDILLNKLPWGIGIIKLPWMQEILTVEWI